MMPMISATLILAAVAVGLVRMRPKRLSRLERLGVVSQQWIAQQRVSSSGETDSHN